MSELINNHIINGYWFDPRHAFAFQITREDECFYEVQDCYSTGSDINLVNETISLPYFNNLTKVEIKITGTFHVGLGHGEMKTISDPDNMPAADAYMLVPIETYEKEGNNE